MITQILIGGRTPEEFRRELEEKKKNAENVPAEPATPQATQSSNPAITAPNIPPYLRVEWEMNFYDVNIASNTAVRIQRSWHEAKEYVQPSHRLPFPSELFSLRIACLENDPRLTEYHRLIDQNVRGLDGEWTGIVGCINNGVVAIYELPELSVDGGVYLSVQKPGSVRYFTSFTNLLGRTIPLTKLRSTEILEYLYSRNSGLPGEFYGGEIMFPQREGVFCPAFVRKHSIYFKETGEEPFRAVAVPEKNLIYF